ncbi:IclR family transcriptional regulator [Rhodopseudomonas sp. B29]|uniref:IclR family transcriptional regulator n=1 Tax=Rhodopseudomonas sp. B29 TaxID=95607 RepID=UPI000348295E|nr:IclR family transcriptional regulator [Rhodopseudomonas sp. B29]
MSARDNNKAGDLSDDDDVVSPRVEQIGVQSVEIAGHILKTLATLEGPQTLTALSQAAGMPSAKAHRYLVSLIRSGLIEQSAVDGRYDFGGAARMVGRAAMNRLDIVRIGTPLLSKLRDELQETVFMGVWTPQGPMVIEWFDIVRPVSVILRPGSILPLHSSALGLVCAAYMPSDIIERALAAEAPQPVLRSRKLSKAKQAEIIARIRSDGFSLVQGDLINGLDAVAVPVLNHRRELVASLAAVGSSGTLDTAPSGRVVRALKAAANRFTQALG